MSVAATMITRRCGAVLLAVLVAVGVLAAGSGVSQAAAATQRPQPQFGPGGSDYKHRGWRVSSGGTGADAWYVFEPTGPRPRRAPLAVVMHGYYEFSGYANLYELIRHTVRKGNVVIYPRWQTGIADPVSRPVRHRAVHGLGGERHPRRAPYLRSRPRPGAAAARARRATSASRSAASSPRTSPTDTGSCGCRSRGRSSSTTRTTAGSTASTSPRSTTRWRGSPRA